MNTQRKNRVLFVVTNHEDLGDTGKKTGYFLREVSYPYKAVTEAGYSVDFVSPNGGPAPMDPNSNDMDDEVNKAFTDDSSIMDQLQNTMSPDQINPDDYDGIMYAGGHGTVWDFPDSEGLANIAISIYERGGVLGAICHGPAALVNLKLTDGTYLIAGKRLSNETTDTICDGLRAQIGIINFPIIKEMVDGIITLSEIEIISAMKMIFERMKILVEPSSAIVLAAAIKNKNKFQGKKIGLIFSGGNVDCDNLPWNN